jgi:hypothetical protein
MATVLKLLRTSVPGRVPTAAQVAQGSLAINLADRRLFSKDHNNEVFRIARPRDPSDYQILHATDGTTSYLGRLAWSDYPATGSPEDSTAWVIYRISTNSAGAVLSETSAQGAWSSKTQLNFS